MGPIWGKNFGHDEYFKRAIIIFKNLRFSAVDFFIIFKIYKLDIFGRSTIEAYIKNGSKQLTKFESQISAHSSPWARESSLQLFLRVKIKFRFLKKNSVSFLDQNFDFDF